MSDKDRFLLYTAEGGAVKVEVLYKEETVWLTQKALAELFGVQRPAITKHLKNIFETGELAENSVGSILEHTAVDGKAYGTKCYNLDAIIAVGYRVNSYQATQFRIWTTRTPALLDDDGICVLSTAQSYQPKGRAYLRSFEGSCCHAAQAF